MVETTIAVNHICVTSLLGQREVSAAVDLERDLN